MLVYRLLKSFSFSTFLASIWFRDKGEKGENDDGLDEEDDTDLLDTKLIDFFGGNAHVYA